MLQPSRLLRLIMFLLFGVYLGLYPGSIILVALDRVPVWGTWMGGALLILQGSLMGCWLAANFGRAGALAALLILLLSWLVEHIGATTGFPFGAYTYTDVLQPQIFGVVPLAIPFAWLLIVTAAVGVSEQILVDAGRSPQSDLRVSRRKVFAAASFALLLDLTIEPFAVHINHYWVWSQSKPGDYYGIPLSNFVAWWFTSLLLVGVLLVLRRSAAQALLANAASARAPQPIWSWLPLTLYVTNLVMFVVINLAHGQATAAVVGGCVMLVIGGAWLAVPLLRRRRRAGQQSGA